MKTGTSAYVLGLWQAFGALAEPCRVVHWNAGGLNLIIQLELIINTFAVSLPVFTHPWTGLIMLCFQGISEGIQILSSRMILELSWCHRLKSQLGDLSVLLQLRWAYWDRLLRWGRENWTHPCSVLTQNVLSRNVGWFVFCGIFWGDGLFFFLPGFWFGGFISYLWWGELFFFQGAIFYCSALYSNLSSHVPLEIQCLIFSYINYSSVLDSFRQKTYVLKL